MWSWPQCHQLRSIQAAADPRVQADSLSPILRSGPTSGVPSESITLPVTFGTEENFRTESVLFDVVEVNLPFNAIIGRPALYRFMAIAHYGYLVLKMPSPAGVERLHALAAEAARSGGRGCTFWR